MTREKKTNSMTATRDDCIAGKGDGDHSLVAEVDAKWSNDSRSSSSGISVGSSGSEGEAAPIDEVAVEEKLQHASTLLSADDGISDCCARDDDDEKETNNNNKSDFGHLLDESFEETPLLTSVVTIIGYGVLVVFGYFRDWLRKYGFEAIYSAKEPNKGPGDGGWGGNVS